MKSNSYLFIIFILFFQVSFSQNLENLYQKWLLKDVSSCTDSVQKYKEEWNIAFISKTKAIVSTNNGLKNERDYSITDNYLKINDLIFSIKKLTQDSLLLTNRANDVCKEYVFLSEKKMSTLQKDNFFINKEDTIYYATKYFFPKRKNGTSYFSYFFKSVPNMAYKENCIFQIRLIIKKNGEVGDYTGNISCIKKSEKKIKKIIDESRGNWTPMYLDGKPVNSLIRVKFRQGKTKIIKGY